MFEEYLAKPTKAAGGPPEPPAPRHPPRRRARFLIDGPSQGSSGASPVTDAVCWMDDYLPVDASWPLKRSQSPIMERSNQTYLLTRPALTPATSARYFMVIGLPLSMGSTKPVWAYKQGRTSGGFRLGEGWTKVSYPD